MYTTVGTTKFVPHSVHERILYYIFYYRISRVTQVRVIYHVMGIRFEFIIIFTKKKERKKEKKYKFLLLNFRPTEEYK